MELHVGMQGHSEAVVNAANTARAMGSGTLEVLATPALVALMEQAAVKALPLPPGQTSVGTLMDVRHTAATPLGMKVWAEAQLCAVDGRRLVFTVTAYDEKEQIGAGTHERFLVDVQRFLEKAAAKRTAVSLK